MNKLNYNLKPALLALRLELHNQSTCIQTAIISILLIDHQCYYGELSIGLERYHEAYPIPNTQYHWPPAIPIPNTDTEYDVIRTTHQCHKFISTGQCYSHSHYRRRSDGWTVSLRYATSAVGALFTKGRKRWLVILF